MTTTEATPANTIMRQIPIWLRRAVGFVSPMDTGDGLQFDCRGRASYRVIVTLTPADLYDVTVWNKNGMTLTVPPHWRSNASPTSGESSTSTAT